MDPSELGKKMRNHSHRIDEGSNWRGKKQDAQPLIRAAWAGAFSVYCSREKISATFHGFRACMSSKAGAPEGFDTDDDIAVFFFPSLPKHETAYDSLVLDLIRDDMALKTSVMGSELLLFTSIELPPLFTRFQAKLYFWGLFRGNPTLKSQYSS